MIHSQKYLLEEIEEFLQINKKLEQEPENESLTKLLSVKDKISIFKGIEAYDLKAIVYDVKFVRFKKNDFVIKQNETREEIYYIISGECSVYSDKKKVAKLSSGEVFGESGAIFKTPRSASVLCSTDEAILLSFCIDDNLEFCASAVAKLYKNLAFEINHKLEHLNHIFIDQSLKK